MMMTTKKQITVDRRSQSSRFLLPLIGNLTSYYEPYLVNVYLGDVSIRKFHPYHLYVLLKYGGDKGFDYKEVALKNHPCYVDSYDIFNGSYVMFVMKITDDFTDDYGHFIRGEYSKFSDTAKAIVTDNALLVDPRSSMQGIFSKADYLKDYWEQKLGTDLGNQEVWPIINMEEELFDRSKY